MPAPSSARRFVKTLLFEQPSSAESASIEHAPSARYRAATICPPSLVIPGKLAATSAPTPSRSVLRASATGSWAAFVISKMQNARNVHHTPVLLGRRDRCDGVWMKHWFHLVASGVVVFAGCSTK